MAKVEELEKALADMTAKLADATAEIETLRQQGKGTAPDPLAKADDAVREHVEQLQKAREEEAARSAALAKRVEKMEAERDRTLYVAKAASFPGMGEADDFGPVLAKIAKALTAEEFDGFAERLRGLHAQVAEGAMFQEIGAGGAAGAEGDAWAKIEAMATEMIGKAAGGMTFEAAVAKVLETPAGQALHRDYRNAQEGR